MLQLKNIKKEYKTGDLVQIALNDVSLNFRDNEFVSILGPSGSGKTTLLNIIGGLDHCDSGDLIINGISTKNYKDRDWDTYRNHVIGFVFQSYNLISHQTILSNVELALTIGGLSRDERKKKAQEALEKVGLGDQGHKKPNQLSGGQMQRVAIARALVNDPDILLADEPTGALDSQTSVQVLELLKEVAKDRLVIMVTHNDELAETYSTRIVKLRDGKIIDDSDPYEVDDALLAAMSHEDTITKHKAKMGFMTSLSLSVSNLRTKIGRTLLTSFAGSIGIIGIALILAISNGVNDYIDELQKDTMTSYPITITSETIDMSSLLDMSQSVVQGRIEEETGGELTGVFSNETGLSVSSTAITENNLTNFKNYLEDEDSDINQYIGENGVVYSYDITFSVFAYDSEGTLVNTNDDPESENSTTSAISSNVSSNLSIMSSLLGGSSSGADNFSQMDANATNDGVTEITTDSYELLYGKWPTAYDEVVLVLDSQNSISIETLYQLGFITEDEYDDIAESVTNEEEYESFEWDYEEICEQTFYLIMNCDRYEENEDGTFSYIDEDDAENEDLIDKAIELKIVGIIKADMDSDNADITTTVAYTSMLTDYIIDYTHESDVVLAQMEDETINVLTNMAFDADDDDAKIEDAKEYLSNLGVSDKASMLMMIMYSTSSDDDDSSSYALTYATYASMSESDLADYLDYWLENDPDEEILLEIYDDYVGGSSYEDNLEAFGYVSYDAPSSISIYTDSFEDKEAVADCIEAYNATVDEDDQITYTDYVALMTSTMTTMVNMITYVLIAFVAVSLVVSCVMISIITDISVLERTKEIGILRALGASKKNISQVFNAETFIIGTISGLLGVGISMLLTIPINSILANMIESDILDVNLPLSSAGILILISIVITVIGGFIPAKGAAKKDPVIALRTE